MEFFSRRHLLSPLLLALVYFTYLTDARSHHIRHHRDRFKRQQGAHLYLPGSYVTDGDDEPDTGPWLEWSSPSQCSRTCGGGVSTQYRQCTPGYRCRGPTRRHFSCNTQDCPDLADFRALQCAEFNTIPFEGALYEWVPYTKSPQPCELNCMPRGERFYYRHKLQVIDGTKCSDESMDVCVEGKCQPVGCDMMLGSDAREDQCRVCEGNGSTCNTMSGLLDMQDLQVGYNDILLIPSGAVNINVREIDRSNNYLAIRNATGHYYLNGNWRIDFPRTLDFAGSKFHYERSPQGFSAPDTITCLGPIEESLFIVLLYQDRNVGIHYEYSIPKSVQHPTDTETYAWTFDQFTSCTASCGGGYQSRNVSCAGRKSLDPVDSNLCDANNKPVETQKCGEIPCDPKWVAKDWGKCSATCGDGGTQTRKIYCEQIISSGVPSIVDDEQCADLKKPTDQQACNQGVVCGEWHVGPWKPCNRLCGKGKETREITCYRKIDGKITVLDASECGHAEKPDRSRSCLLRPCEGVDWVASEWSGCENKCGLSEETRVVQCMTATGEVFPDTLCAEDEEKPETARKCATKGCDYEWYASQWSECSAKCGSGVQTRKVLCTKTTDEGFKKVEELNCDPSKKYDAVRNCTAKETECPGEWFTGPWTKCTKDCGVGLKTRKVLCIKGNKTAHVKDCDPELTPSSSEECNKQACDKDEIIPVDTEKATIITTEEPSEIEGDDEYEIVVDDDCEDGEWVDANGIPQRKLGPSEKLLSVVSKSLGESTDTDSKMQRDSSFAEEELMLGDSYNIGDADSGQVALLEESGSGDGTISGTASPLPASFRFTESSGDFSITSEGSGDGTGLTEVTETIFQSSLYTLGTFRTYETTDEPDIDITESTEPEGRGLWTEEPITTTDVFEVSSELAISQIATDVTDVTDKVSETTSEQPDTSATKEPGVTSVEPITDVTDITSTATEVTPSESGTDVTDVSTKVSDVTSEQPDTDVTVTGISSKETEPTTEGVATDTTDISSKEPAPTSEKSVTDITAVSIGEETGVTTEKVATDVTLTSCIDTSVEGSEVTEQPPTDITDESITPEITAKLGSAITETVTEEGSTTEIDVTATTEESTSKSLITKIVTQIIEITEPIETDGTTTEVDEIGSTTEAITKISKESVATEKVVTSTEVIRPATDQSTEITEEPSITTKEPSLLETTTESIIGTTLESIVSGVTSIFTSLTGLTEGWTTDLTDITEEVTTSSAVTEDLTTSKGITEETTTLETTTERENVTDVGVTETGEEVTVKTTEYDIWSSTESPITVTARTTLIELFNIPKLRWCKRLRKPSCKRSEFGCCPDKITPAKGPFDKGCPIPTTCDETKYGCCEDGVSPAAGENFKGCPASQCDQTIFGCCSDNKTPSQGNNNEGCPPPPPECAKSIFGCCEDNATEAKGPNEEGCKEKEDYTTDEVVEQVSTTSSGIEYTTTEGEDCNNTIYGCCPDGVSIAQGESFKGCDLIHPTDCNKSYYKCCPDGITSAQGPNYQGCEIECLKSTFGCCDDGVTPSHGYNKEGCCLNTQYGCCPDNVKPAEGPKQEGCGCAQSIYGCCPDNVTLARGYNKEGCGCQYTQHGCCPDNHAEAKGPDYEGCPCHTFQFGCCPDGVKIAQGLRNEGCGCAYTEFGCCSDETTAASGPNFAGCDCTSAKYGCCPDGEAEAQGENFDGCLDAPEDLQAHCQLSKDRGTCRNYTVRWFYDMEYGGCSRFWYGGCDGNGNRFKSKEDCINICVEPTGKDRCNLPKVAGPCEGYYPQWHYDKGRNLCTQFIYGGCLGNNNRFETRDECNELCVTDSISDPCEQAQEPGPCHGDFINWYYNKESGYCEQFIYGGCKGNSNNFPTEAACKQKCAPASEKKPSCSLQKVQGDCKELLPRWYYDSSDERCMPFYYTGCGGNSNNFVSQYHCELDCPKQYVKETCQLPADSGECSNYVSRYYYDTRDKACKHFYYGGCGGNKNNFISEGACTARCEDGEVETEAPPPPPHPEVSVTTEGPEPFKTEYCYLPPEAGPCRKAEARWYYNNDGTCRQFAYGGCGGNRNNFVTSEECSKMCGHAEDVCNLPMTPGPCNADYAAWYFNQTTNTCDIFKYGGCMGNGNKFDDLESCEKRCKKVASTQAPEVQTYDPSDPRRVCLKLVEPGTCNETIPAFYYDPNNVKCAAFTYSGCGGNENRFTSIESCERYCGKYRGHDACTLPSEIGPCRGYFTKYYYDISTGTCKEFLYGGCEGNANRYSTIEDCYSVCGSRQPVPQPDRTTTVSPLEVCLLTADTGTCREGSQKRWYYDNTKGECIAFIFSGCGGNANNFYSHNDCLQTCRQFIDNVYEPERGLKPQPQPEPEPEQPDVCKQYQDECATLRCQYGMKGYVENLCNRCKCVDPCEGVTCSLETRCAIELNRNQTDSSDISTFIGVCREINKPGDCPYIRGSGDECREDCKDDADCLMDLICCANDCGHVCIMPSVATQGPPAELRTTTALPGYTQRPYIRDTFAPEVIEEEFNPVVTAGEGDYATLKCAIRGNPKPTFTWSKEEVLIDGKEPRYRILLEGAALQIISLYKTDAGIYLCSADNNIGKPLKKEIRLEVIDPVHHPTKVIDDQELSNVVVSLGSPAMLNCYAYGYPPPVVMWWKDNEFIPFRSHEYTISKDHTLLINGVKLHNLGVYTCQAYNGVGKATSWSVTVKTMGPVYSTNIEDRKYMKYVIGQKEVPTTPRPDTPLAPIQTTPFVPQSTPIIITSSSVISTTPTPTTTVVPTAPRIYTVPVRANITLATTNYPVGSLVNIPCDVEGFPIPIVQWYRDGKPLSPSRTVQITESHRLIINNATEADSGEYRCAAWNQYSNATSTIPLLIQGRFIHPRCKDNPFFANCPLIIKANFCSHKYYARFCCRSCTEAGMLPSVGPHLGSDSVQNDQNDQNDLA